MDGTTEPIIAVLGHPIAGNPSQFAVERALRSMELDWRVVSFDVRPEDIPAAMEGLRVLGIEGVLIDPSVARAASKWYADSSKPDGAQQHDSQQDDSRQDDSRQGDSQQGDSPQVEPIDCLYRDAQRQLVGSFEERLWLQRQTGEKMADEEQESGTEQEDRDADNQKPRQWILLGDSGRDSPLSGFGSCDFGDLPTKPQQIASASLILIADDEEGPVELDAEDWPESDGSTWVVDLTEGHPERAMVEQLGYRVVNDLERRIGTLHGCLKRWTGQTPSRDVIHEAIEEYLGV